MRQTCGTLNSINLFAEEYEIWRLDFVDQTKKKIERRFQDTMAIGPSMLNENPQMPTNKNRSILSLSTFFVVAALLNFVTVGSAAPTHKLKLLRRNIPLSIFNLPELEETILPDTERHKFATVIIT